MGVSLPTYFGYYNAQRGILAAQAALNVVNNNISSADVDGYSRQRANLASAAPYSAVSLLSNMTPGQFGQGVMVQDLTRFHNNFIDSQYRSKTSSKNFYEGMQDVMSQMESVLAEPNGRTITDATREFFAAAQDLATNPDNIAVRQQFMQRAEDMLFVLQQQATQLQELRTDLVGDTADPSSISNSQLAVETGSVNEILSQIASLNLEITKVSSSGASPNTLLDQRDVLLDKLSEKMNFTIQRNSNSPNVDILLNGNVLVRGSSVVNTLNVIINPGPVPSQDDQPSLVELSSNPGVDISSSITEGKMGAYIRMGGVTAGESTIRNVMVQMDTLFNEIATDLNGLQAVGRDLNGNIPVAPDNEIFNLAAGTTLSLFRYSVNANIKADPRLIAAASDISGAFEGPGDGRNALLMAQLETSTVNATLGNVAYNDYMANTITQLGVRSSSSKGEAQTADNIIQSILERRQAVQGVNTDEELINLVKFQRTLEASSRAFQAIDESVRTILAMVQ